MKNILIILLGLYTFSANTGELKRESSGFSETEEFKFENVYCLCSFSKAPR